MRIIPYDPNKGVTYPFGEPKYSGILLDGFTQLMINACEQINADRKIREEEKLKAGNKLKEGEELERNMYDVKMSVEAYGSLAENMLRAMNPITRFSQGGIPVIMTSLLAENPKWNRALAAAPAMRGRQFPIDFQGMCDYIGYVDRYHKKDSETGKKKLTYPPLVWFEPNPDMNILCKWTGKRYNPTANDSDDFIMMFPLNFAKMMERTEIEGGFVAFLYGETGVGKTTSILQTFPHSKEKPMLAACAERRNIEISIKEAGVPRENIVVAIYEDWFGFIDFLNDDSIFFNRDSAVVTKAVVNFTKDTSTKTGGQNVKKDSTSTVKAPGI